jgi:broad specificity phosphatase PhoE
MWENPQENADRVRRLYEAFNAADFAEVRDAHATSSTFKEARKKAGELGRLQADLFDPEIELGFSSMPVFPGGNVHKGERAWFEFWRAWLKPWESFSYHVKRIQTVRNRVLAEVVQRGRVAEAPEIATTLFGLFTFERGKVTRLEFFATRSEAEAAAAEL